ncbi:MAG: N-acetylmuramic acid 6-phosphate etherase [Chloroflexi bacterium]|nr:N-acetylmuramic acid 6-phosphate etherase [Chloroflexota bacterium]
MMQPLTESRNLRTQQIDRLSTVEILEVINDEDASVATVIREVLPAIAQAVDVITAQIRLGGRLIYAGAGTSGRLGVLDAVECQPTFSTPPEMVQALLAGGEPAMTQAVEGAEDRYEAGKTDLLALNATAADVVIGIAASGTTPYVIGVLDTANALGAKTVAISCNAPAPILDRASIKIVALVGPEVITGSTRMKAGTAQKMILNMLTTTSMIKLGKVYGNLMVDVRVTNQKLANRARGMVAEVVGTGQEEAARLLQMSHNEVKTAIVVGLLNISVEEARQRLTENRGMLRNVIELPLE